MISKDILLEAEAVLKEYKRGEQLFKEGDTPRYYYQVYSGEIKMNNHNDDGKEYIQGIFDSGKSFGEPPLFADFKYPANAEAITDARIWLLPKDKFLKVLEKNPLIHHKFTSTLALRLYYKAMMVSEISTQEPEHRILRILDYFKKNNQNTTTASSLYKIELTRQQLADLTGLRVETVIRAVKKLEQKGELLIKDRKIYR
ncbi:cAMP-binding domain of CRP or a regulatory subunit of cAMP-dependent protein kinases [Aquimarina amphilecti]|uniref:cAMP-binding domain of CRP or a regulatory subunit of cAMP-dependent protein kinases n=1 Tax=Aquimarina amphilecti TaxID=1038014 RepID=A0A1H7VVR3_AQUAM|nr:Crp/Fnr family transcriptional regulator [Aquimarina amphilecti]SEM12897.1 cAMP-binding domain of CRP or a regulatory subunit of cAMP-dependent protein kinases [Aquimarina amphilecti]